MVSLMRVGGVLLGIAMVACGARPDAQPDATAPEMVVTVSTDRSRYRSGEPIRITLVARNASSDSVTLSFSSRQRYDVAIQTVNGDERWRWSADMLFAQVLGEERVAPGASLEYSETFADSLVAGSYVAVGAISAAGAVLEAQTRFQVE